MSNFALRVANEFLKLTAFVTCTVIYYIFVRDDSDVMMTTALKCAPIVSLILYVSIKGLRFNEDYRYSQFILLGLIFSCFGDALLNVDLFPHGMAAFGVAQIMYISAFRLEPLNLKVGIPIYLAAGAMIGVIFHNLDPIIKVGLPIYALLLTTMCWRALVRALETGGYLAWFAGVGSVLFVISDTLISVTMFVTPLAHDRIYIMSTYYFAQFLIALSTYCDVDDEREKKV